MRSLFTSFQNRGLKTPAIFFFLFAVVSIFFSAIAVGQRIPNTSPTCTDVLLIFARGSGSNPNSLFLDDPYGTNFAGKEEVPGSFFKAFQTKIEDEYPKVTYKAVSVHNFPNLYNPNGYKAVGIFGATTFLNAVQAEYAWFPFGEYNTSMGDGKQETAGYIKDQISLCPNQQLILGGYSQGAQVMGETVFMLSNEERQHVSALALFGDPKYVGSDISHTSSTLNWFDSALSVFTRPKAKPWKRGSAGLNDRGLADARIPYLPTDLENRTLSWCFNDDFVCTGGSGIFQTLATNIQNGSLPSPSDYSNGHTRYATFGAPQAAGEIIQRMAPSLSDLDESRGGKNPDGSPTQIPPTIPSSKPIDIMMMLNTSSGVDDVLGQMRFSTLDVIPPLSAFYGNVLYGIGEYTENGDLPNRRVPKVVIHQNLTANLTNLNNKMYRPLSNGITSAGGLDAPDPHQLGVERAVMSTNWRSDSEKHIVIITPRMPLSPYAYNICNSDVRIGFGITSPNNCNVNPVLETDPASQHPERCSKTYDVLTKTNCNVGLTNPFHTYNVIRKTDDAIALAQARGIAIDVVVPSEISPFFDSSTGTNYTVSMIVDSLKKIANNTGGVFVQYSSFTKANYTDMLWRILNHKSKILPLAAVEDYDKLGAVDGLSAFKPREFKTNEPILFDATSDNAFSEYRWDFDGDGVWDESTPSPQTDYTYKNSLSQVFASVAGFNNGIEQSRSLLPINVSVGANPEEVLTPELPNNLKAVRDAENVVISWQQTNEQAVLFVGDPASGLPLVSKPLSDGVISIPDPDKYFSNLVVWVDNGQAASNRIGLTIEEPVIENPEPDVIVEPDEVIVGDGSSQGEPKVLNESEARPNSQFIGGQQVVQGAENPTKSNEDSSESSESRVALTEVKGESVEDTNDLQSATGITQEELRSEFDTSHVKNQGSGYFWPVFGLLAIVIIICGAMFLMLKIKKPR